MKIYLAARYGRRAEMQRVRDKLQAIGIDVVSRWIDGAHEAADLVATDAERSRWAGEDLVDLARADAIVAFTEEAGSKESRGGRHVEFGIAIGLGKHLCVVGPRENIFYCNNTIYWYPDYLAFYAAMGVVSV